MSNKLETAINDLYYDLLNNRCSLDGCEATEKTIIMNALVDYARSVVPTENEMMEEYNNGRRTLRQFYLDRIDQDINSLTDTK